MDDANVDVMIAGAGPVGLMAALSLSRRGIRARIVDPAATASVHSKAMVLHAAALETLQTVGVADAVVAAGLRVPAYNMYDARGRLLIRHEMHDLPTRFSFALHVPQSATEGVLIAALRDAEIEVERGVAVTGFTQDAEGVDVRTSDGREVRAGYLLGCDGPRSTVRGQLGLELHGKTYAERFVLADCELRTELDPGEAHSFLVRQGLLSLLPLRDTMRVILPMFGDDRPLSESFLSDAIAERTPPGVGLELRRVQWLSDFRVHRRIAERYRIGRVFVCGDAAHIHSPAGGQGLGVGLKDALECTSRLAAVMHGAAAPEVLDGYEAARRPAAQRVLAQTDRLTKMFTARSLPKRILRRLFFAAVRRLPPVRNAIRLGLAGLPRERRGRPESPGDPLRDRGGRRAEPAADGRGDGRDRVVLEP